MDRLVLRFRRTQPGAAFVAAWQASRIVRDLGSSAPATPPPTPPTPGSIPIRHRGPSPPPVAKPSLRVGSVASF
jgi:hypothetical protein